MNITASEWAYINKQLAERQLQGKESEVFKRAFRIPQSRIKKQGRVHSHQTILARFAPSMLIADLVFYLWSNHKAEVHIATPMDIRVSTPPPQALTPVLVHNVPIPNLFDFRYTPWRQFVLKFNRFVQYITNHGISLDSLVQPATLCCAGKISLPIQNATFMNATQFADATNHAARTSTSRFLRPRYGGLLPELRDEHDSSLAIRGTQLEILKYLIGMVSNGHNAFYTSEKIWILAQDQRNLEYLSRVLTSGEFTVRAFREKILFIALGDPNLKIAPSLNLMNVVLDSGADINAKDVTGSLLINRALHNLARCGYSYYNDGRSLDYLEIVLALINRGACWATGCTDTCSAIGCTDTHSGLEILIDCTARKTLYKAADWIPKIRLDCLNITVKTYVWTAYLGSVDIFEHLSHLTPAILATLKESPWLLFEAAAFGNNSINMIKYLSHIGLDITAVDEAGHGNPLVFAPLSSTSGVFQYLVDIGLSIHRHANREMEKWLPPPRLMHELGPESCDGVAPIHAAIFAGNYQAVEYLLKNGVDPNQCGYRLPIQLAAIQSGSVGLNITKLLMATGANVNSTARNEQPEVIQFNGYLDERISLEPHSTALLIAARYGNLATFRMLYEGGAKLPQPPNCSCEQYHVVSEINVWNEVHSDNILFGEVQTEDDWRGEMPPYYHIPTEEGCPYSQEVLWNPLLLVSKARRETSFDSESEFRCEELFLHLLKVASPRIRKSWTTRKFFSSFVQGFGWRFVTQSISDGIFDLSCFDEEEFLIRAIQEKDDYWTYHLIHDRSLRSDSMRRAFLMAGYMRYSASMQMFLEKNCWPDEEIDLSCSDCDGDSYEGINTPLDYVLEHRSDGCDGIRDDFLKHYIDSSKRGQNHLVHFAKAHETALRYGDIEFARRVNPHENINDIYGRVFAPFADTLWFNEVDKTSMAFKLTTCVQVTTAHRQYTATEWLMDEGADPDIDPDTQSGTQNGTWTYHSPLQCVVRDTGPIQLVTTLIERGADVNRRPIGIRGATALQFAAMNGNIEMLKVLLEAGAYVNAPPCKWEGRTAIEGAAELGRLDTVSLLLEAGADVEGRTNLNYRRTIFRAWAHGHLVLVEMVQEWRKKRYGIESYEPTESIVESMDMETLGYAGRDLLPVLDPSHSYFNPCQACTDSLSYFE